MQGDIVAVYNTAGTKLVSYVYDAWGNTTVTYHNGGASTVAANNPFRYRGYYYDADFGLYYLQTRYYDSVVGRFINLDNTLYFDMLGYNTFAYCNNNPSNYIDPTGENAASLLLGWLSGAGTAALAEPTILGELVSCVGAAVIGGVWLGEKLVQSFDYIENNEGTVDPPQSVTDSDDDIEEKSDSPSSPGKMQKEIDKGQAPKDIKSAHKPHDNQKGKPHVHFKDKTALNNDGTIHDAHRGTPKLTKPVKEWLKKHNWSTEMKIFP